MEARRVSQEIGAEFEEIIFGSFSKTIKLELAVAWLV